MKFNKKKITNTGNTFIIAEIGINHQGSFKKCIKMINQAKIAGADAVKLQIVNTEESYEKGTTSYKLFKKSKLKFKELIKIKEFCKKKKIFFLATPGDFSSLNQIFKLRLPIVKFSSGLMDNQPLILQCIKKKMPMILSTGLADNHNLTILRNFLKRKKAKNYSILKCTSEYPAKIKNLNLNKIDYLKKFFKCVIGYSDHYPGYSASILAVSNGAKIIEKHFTYNKNLKGADHYISLELKEFKAMVKIIREIDKIKLSENSSNKFILHSPNKKFLRKLVAISGIKEGDSISLKNIGFQRLKKIKKSLEPKKFFLIHKKKSKINIKKGTVISEKLLKKI